MVVVTRVPSRRISSGSSTITWSGAREPFPSTSFRTSIDRVRPRAAMAPRYGPPGQTPQTAQTAQISRTPLLPLTASPQGTLSGRNPSADLGNPAVGDLQLA